MVKKGELILDINNPKVSVIMSVYNEEQFLKESVDSILNQTFKNFEFIIIDDGSTDRTPEILKHYKDKRLKIINQENMGLTKSLNKGVKLAHGEYIARMDADDISELSRIEKQVEALEIAKDVAVVASWYSIIDEEGNEIIKEKIPCRMKELSRMFQKSNPFCHGSVMMRRDILKKVGLYREKFRYAQDYDLWLRMLAKGYQFYVIPEFLYRLRISRKAISKRHDQRLCRTIIIREFRQGYQGKNERCKKDLVATVVPHNRGKKISKRYIQAFYYYSIGTVYCEQGNNSRSRAVLLRAIRIDPLLLRAWYRLLLTFLPQKVQHIFSSVVNRMVSIVDIIKVRRIT